MAKNRYNFVLGVTNEDNNRISLFGTVENASRIPCREDIITYSPTGDESPDSETSSYEVKK